MIAYVLALLVVLISCVALFWRNINRGTQRGSNEISVKSEGTTPKSGDKNEDEALSDGKTRAPSSSDTLSIDTPTSGEPKLAPRETSPSTESQLPPHELDALEAHRIARLASRKLNRERLFSLTRVIRSEFGLRMPNPIDKDDKAIIDDYNNDLNSTKLPPSRIVVAPKKIEGPMKKINNVLPIDRFEVLSLGNITADNITQRAAPGEERPKQVVADPVRVGVPLPHDAEEVKCAFFAHGFDLEIWEARGQKRRLKITDLEREIDPEESFYHMKRKNKVILTMQKKDPNATWYNLQGQIKRTTAEALKKAEKTAKTDPNAAIQEIVGEFCSNLPKHADRESEVNTANEIHARLMMGFESALEKTHQQVQEIEAGRVERPVFT